MGKEVRGEVGVGSPTGEVGRSRLTFYGVSDPCRRR